MMKLKVVLVASLCVNLLLSIAYWSKSSTPRRSVSSGDLLVWRSDGMMINAAVMGLLAPVRYVLLSDGLLATMNVSQIEAVFGHEAGHVRHRHIQHFLLFALAGWFLVVGLMELLVRTVGIVGRSAAGCRRGQAGVRPANRKPAPSSSCRRSVHAQRVPHRARRRER